jgi:DNA mismatch endonuclease (patch repair protein)
MVNLLRTAGIIGWRRSVRLTGRPDFVFRAERLALFVDGCFWHGCPRHARIPKTRVRFWGEKLAGNARRDRVVTRALRKSGWRVLRIWECALNPIHAEHTAARIKRALKDKTAIKRRHSDMPKKSGKPRNVVSADY